MKVRIKELEKVKNLICLNCLYCCAVEIVGVRVMLTMLRFLLDVNYFCFGCLVDSYLLIAHDYVYYATLLFSEVPFHEPFGIPS